MSTPRRIDVEQVRKTAKEIVERLKTDPAFAAQLKEDPVTTLSSAGMPDLTIPFFVQELSELDDVSGYMQGFPQPICSPIGLTLSCIYTT